MTQSKAVLADLMIEERMQTASRPRTRGRCQPTG